MPVLPAFRRVRLGSTLALVAACALMGSALPISAQTTPPAPAGKSALSVSVVSPQVAQVATTLAVTGSIAPWQEAIVGAELAGQRLVDVLVEVGQRVQKGQVLARFAEETVRADLALAEADLAQGQALLADAVANARRARELEGSGMITQQGLQQALTNEHAAKARVAAQQAALRNQQLRVGRLEVLAPDDGLISARQATVGSVPSSGQELFRLIRQGRLEWRAEVPSAELHRLHPGQEARLTTPSGQVVVGTLRKMAPTVDAQTRNALVYVDLKTGPSSDARAGMFARGEFRLEPRRMSTLPASALLLRDGFDVVLRVDENSRVRQTKVKVTSRDGDRVAIEGLAEGARVVERGGAFLADGDLVKVVASGAAR